jgi:GT2 family glycosyltransferase
VHQPVVSIVVVNWNGLGFLKDCLSKLTDQVFSDFEIIVVDNGSDDGSVEFIRASYPQVVLLENKTNRGFAAANNQGIDVASGRYIAVLNNDTEVDKNWLKNLVRRADSSSSDVGMWTCKILSMEDHTTIDSVGGLLISSCGIAKGRGRSEKDRGQYDRDEGVFIPSACAAMYRKKMLDEVGSFDEDFFAYCEDTDLGLRARLAGWGTQSVPDAVVYHHYSGTAGKYTPVKAYLVERNHIWVAMKNFPIPMLITLPAITIWRLLLQLYALAMKKGAGGRYTEDFSKASLFHALLRAWWSALKGMPGMLRKRREIQGKRVASRREVAEWFREYGLKVSEIVFKE